LVLVPLLTIAMDFLNIGQIATFIPPTIGLLSTSLFGSMAWNVRGYWSLLVRAELSLFHRFDVENADVFILKNGDLVINPYFQMWEFL
jgi:hypothetical protein